MTEERQTKLYQLELDQSHVNCGMSYVFRLVDGRFFIIDGGYFTPGEEDRLYQFLTSNADGPPVIAGWFFTHAHQDHVGNFIQFIWKYHALVTIEKLLYSFHPVDLSEVEGDWKSSDPATIKEFYGTVEAYCGDIEKVTLKKGDRLAFDELQLEVIYTYEALYPENSSFNDYSTVIATTVGDTRILWLADVGAKASKILLESPDKLKSDVVQISHHGIDNFPILCDLYAAIGARVALWPTPDYGMVDRRAREVNDFVLSDVKIREHIVSGYGTACLPLPYTIGSAVKNRKAYSFERQPDDTGCWDQTPGSRFRYCTPDEIGDLQTGT